MLKFESKFKVGDVIRAYDFEPCRGRGDSFIEGTIVDTCMVRCEYKAFVVHVVRKVAAGKEYTGWADARTYVPMEMFDDYDHRIIAV